MALTALYSVVKGMPGRQLSRPIVNVDIATRMLCESLFRSLSWACHIVIMEESSTEERKVVGA